MPLPQSWGIHLESQVLPALSMSRRPQLRTNPALVVVWLMGPARPCIHRPCIHRQGSVDLCPRPQRTASAAHLTQPWPCLACKTEPQMPPHPASTPPAPVLNRPGDQSPSELQNGALPRWHQTRGLSPRWTGLLQISLHCQRGPPSAQLHYVKPQTQEVQMLGALVGCQLVAKYHESSPLSTAPSRLHQEQVATESCRRLLAKFQAAEDAFHLRARGKAAVS